MKRALAALEATLIALNILVLQQALRGIKDFNWYKEELIHAITRARDEWIMKTFILVNRKMIDIKLEEKIEKFVQYN